MVSNYSLECFCNTADRDANILAKKFSPVPLCLGTWAMWKLTTILARMPFLYLFHQNLNQHELSILFWSGKFHKQYLANVIYDFLPSNA